MKCNNTYCYWQAFDNCCHESKKAYTSATPNQLDCPVSLRKDFEEQLCKLADECIELINKRSMRELIQIKKFIEKQWAVKEVKG